MLFLNAIDRNTFILLKRLQALPALSETRLVGGTSLALQLGHRVSIDLDIFGKWDYSLDLQEAFSIVGKTEKVSGAPNGKMAFFYVDGIKVDCISYERYEWLEPPVEEDGVRLAGIKDIGAMKVNAITNRGTRKDFVDLARLLEDYPLDEIFSWYRMKYPDAVPSLALRSLSYFVDAETAPMPKMLVPFDWESAKERIGGAVRNLVLRPF